MHIYAHGSIFIEFHVQMCKYVQMCMCNVMCTHAHRMFDGCFSQFQQFEVFLLSYHVKYFHSKTFKSSEKAEVLCLIIGSDLFQDIELTICFMTRDYPVNLQSVVSTRERK